MPADDEFVERVFAVWACVAGAEDARVIRFVVCKQSGRLTVKGEPKPPQRVMVGDNASVVLP